MTTTVEMTSVSPFSGEEITCSREQIEEGGSKVYERIYTKFPSRETEDICVTNLNDYQTLIEAGDKHLLLNLNGQGQEFYAHSELPIGTTGLRIINVYPSPQSEC